MPFRPAENAFDTEEEKSFIEPQVQRARDTLLDELDFVISRPDILKLIVDITMFGRRYDYAKSKLEIETGSPQYMELFSPIQPRIDLILHTQQRSTRPLHIILIEASLLRRRKTSQTLPDRRSIDC